VEGANDSLMNLREVRHFNCNPIQKISLAAALFLPRELFLLVSFKVESFLTYDDEIVNWASEC